MKEEDYMELKEFRKEIKAIVDLKELKEMRLDLYMQLTQKSHEKIAQMPEFFFIYPPIGEFFSDLATKSVKKRNVVIVKKIEIIKNRENELCNLTEL